MDSKSSAVMFTPVLGSGKRKGWGKIFTSNITSFSDGAFLRDGENARPDCNFITGEISFSGSAKNGHENMIVKNSSGEVLQVFEDYKKQYQSTLAFINEKLAEGEDQ